MKELTTRKNIRLKGHDYSASGTYFVTICIKDKHELLGKVISGSMCLSDYGSIAHNELCNIPTHYEHVIVDKFIVMPNHVHMILLISGRASAPPTNMPPSTVGAPLAAPVPLPPPTPIPSSSVPISQTPVTPVIPTIGNIVRGYKSGVSRNIGFSIWQRNYHDHIIRNKEEYQKISQYIDENPMRWKEDKYYAYP